MMDESKKLSTIGEIDEKIVRLVLNEYTHECERIENSINEDGYIVPFIGDLARLVYSELWTEERVLLIDAAIYRKEDTLFGYSSSEEFMIAVWKKEVDDPSLQPQIKMDDVLRQIYQFLMENQMFFVDYHNIIRNTPIKEVW